jgi:biotin operon repressor
MNKFEKACIKTRLLNLARRKATGPPAELAEKFETSERSIKRYVNELREEGNPIKYDYNRMSYVIEEISNSCFITCAQIIFLSPALFNIAISAMDV